MQCIPGGKEVFKILGIEYRETETEEREVGGGRDGGERGGREAHKMIIPRLCLPKEWTMLRGPNLIWILDFKFNMTY